MEPYSPNSYAAKTVAAPIAEPVSLSDAKTHLRVTHGEEDPLIASYIRAARQTAETLSGRCWITRTMEQRHRRWSRELETFPGPLVSVDLIQYRDQDGETITVDPDDYHPNEHDARYGVRFRRGFAFPELDPDHPAPITVRYKAGYGVNPEDVPDNVIQAMKMLIAHWHVNRMAVVSGTIATELPHGFSALLNLNTVYAI